MPDDLLFAPFQKSAHEKVKSGNLPYETLLSWGEGCCIGKLNDVDFLPSILRVSHKISLGISSFDMSYLGIFGSIEIYDTQPLNSSSGR